MPDNPTNTTNIDPKHADEQLAGLKDTLLALDAKTLVPIRLDLLGVVTRALEVFAVAREDRGLFESTFKSFPLDLIDNLETFALALWAAETQYRRLEAQNKATMTRPDAQLLEECRALKSELLTAAAYTWRHDDIVKELLADIRRGTGFVDLADDLNRISDLYSARWSYANGKSEVTKDDVSRASELSTTLLKAVASRETDEVTKWADLRRRAWTNLSHSYDEIRIGATYIHRNDPSRLAAYPSFYVKPSKK